MDIQKRYRIGGDLEVSRIGFGSMRLSGPGNWGYPADRAGAVDLLRKVVDWGVTLIDTSDAYGLATVEELIAEALHPYPDNLVIATKGGLTRSGPNLYGECGRPEYLSQCIALSLRRLKVDRIDLYQLHRVDPKTPIEESIEALAKAQAEGKIRHIGLSEVSLDQLQRAQKVCPIASVQNLYNLSDRAGWSGDSERLVDYCTANNIAFLPWAPLDRSALLQPDAPLATISAEIGATASQVAIAWLLARSPVMVPIPGTTSAKHLRENLDAADVRLTQAMYDRLTSFAQVAPSPFAGGAAHGKRG